jgi:3-mercaptopyruvate sulfurtransferase SseA
MTRRLFIPAALALAAVAAALLGACKATDTTVVSNAGTPQSASKKAGPAAPAAGTTGTTTVDADGVRRVTVAELRKMLDEGSVVIYDTRAKMEYDREHVRGAISMPLSEVTARAGELAKGKTLVFYCT